jgi:NAD(P)-dependent dehydrogenase (short-subunit alcohol dehydrogenase family)
MVHSKNLEPEMIWDPLNFNGSQAYSDSKLALILFTFKLDRLTDQITVNSLHPGVINTKLLRKGWGAGGSSVKKGAETPVYLALSDEVKEISGSYFVNKKKGRTAAAASDKKLQDQLWNKSIEMIKYQGILDMIPSQFLK